MPDISMCANLTCPQRKTCLRHAVSGTVAGEWQSYGAFEYIDGKCDSYWPVTEPGKPKKPKAKKPKVKKVEPPKDEVVCKLELTATQASVVESALELYCRLHLGQFWAIQSEIFPKQYEWEKREKLEAACKAVFMPELGSNSYYGIGSDAVDDCARVAWVVQKTMRYCRSWATANKHPQGGRDWATQLGVNFDSPDMPSYGMVVKCEYVSAAMKVSWPWK